MMMAFRIKPDESVGKCVRRLVRAQIDRSLDALKADSPEGRETLIHDVRKRFKRIRAVIRLAGDGLDAEIADREGSRFRDAGRPLSEVRDAGVLVQTLDRLLERFGDQGRPEVVEGAREELLRRKREICRRVLDDEDVLSLVASVLEEARPEVKRWEVSGGRRALENGVERIYRRCAHAFREALSEPTDERLHEWRKRTKDLWYVLDILAPVRPAFLGGRAEQANRLADALGDDHDLAVLMPFLSDLGGDSAAVILPQVLRRRAELQRDAFALGPALLHDSTDHFVARLRAYWKAWRAETDAARFE